MFTVQFLLYGEWHTDFVPGMKTNVTLFMDYARAIVEAEAFFRFHGNTTQVVDIDGEVYAQFGNTPDDGPMPENDCCCSECD